MRSWNSVVPSPFTSPFGVPHAESRATMSVKPVSPLPSRSVGHGAAHEEDSHSPPTKVPPLAKHTLSPKGTQVSPMQHAKSTTQVTSAQSTPNPWKVPPPDSQLASVAGKQLPSGLQHAPVGEQLVVSQDSPSPRYVPPKVLQSLGLSISQVTLSKQQAPNASHAAKAQVL